MNKECSAILGNIADIESGYACGRHNSLGKGLIHFRPYNISISGSVDFSKLKHVEPNYSQKRLAYGDIVFNNTNSSELVGKTCYYDRSDEVGYSNHMTRIRINPAHSNFKFIAYQLHYFYFAGKYVNQIKHHVNQSSINNDQLSKYEVFYPDKAYQDNVVDEIEKQLPRLDATIKSLQAVKKKLDVYRKSALEFTLKGEINSYDSSNWREIKLGEISDIRGGFAFKSAEMKESGKYQIIKIGNVKMGKLKLETKPAYLTELDERIIKKYLVKNKDILITLTGTKGKRDYGFVSLVETDRLLLLNQRVARIRVSGDIDPKYIELILRSKNLQDQFFEGETGIVGQGNIGMPSLTNLSFKLPSIEQQKQIVQEIESRFSIIDKLEEAVDKALSRAELLRKSILKSAFEGKLINMAGEA